jgi:hypothetical protein
MNPISLSPSAASTWSTCTASPILLADNKHLLAEETSRAYADEGVEAHHLAASRLLLGKNPADDYPDIEMLRYVEAYAQFVDEHRRNGDDLIVEHKVSLFYMKHRHGYVDAGLVHPRSVTIIDLKYGQGISVAAFRNKQLAIYARSLVEEHRAKVKFSHHTVIRIIIFQPRVFRGEKVSVWEISLAELERFTDELASIANFIQAQRQAGTMEGLVFAPSDDNCRFCKGVGLCKAYEQWTLGDLEALTDLENGGDVEDETDMDHYLLGDSPPVPLPPGTLHAPENLSPVARASLVRNAGRIIKYLERLKAYAEARLQAGHKEDVPGFKMAYGNPGHRYWNDPAIAARLLARHLSAQERWEQSLISPAQAEKLLKDKDLTKQYRAKLDAVISKGAPKLVMVEESDPRPESGLIQAELEFDNLTDTEDPELVDDILRDMLQ